MREEQDLAGRERRRQRVAIDRGLGRIRRQQHDHVGPSRSVGDVGHPQALGEGASPRLAGGGQADGHRHAAVAQVQRVRVAL